MVCFKVALLQIGCSFENSLVNVMSRFFIIAFEILALVALLRSPFVHYWFNDIQSGLANWMLELSLVAEKRQLDHFRDNIISHSPNLKEYQREYLINITANKTAIRNFNQLYCESADKNPYLYGATLHFICAEMSSSKVLDS